MAPYQGTAPPVAYFYSGRSCAMTCWKRPGTTRFVTCGSFFRPVGGGVVFTSCVPLNRAILKRDRCRAAKVSVSFPILYPLMSPSHASNSTAPKENAGTPACRKLQAPDHGCLTRKLDSLVVKGPFPSFPVQPVSHVLCRVSLQQEGAKHARLSSFLPPWQSDRAQR